MTWTYCNAFEDQLKIKQLIQKLQSLSRFKISDVFSTFETNAAYLKQKNAQASISDI